MFYKTAAGIETVGVTEVLGVLEAVSSTTSVAVPSVATIVIEYVHEVMKSMTTMNRTNIDKMTYIVLKLSKGSVFCIFLLFPFLCFSMESGPWDKVLNDIKNQKECALKELSTIEKDSQSPSQSYFYFLGRIDSYNECINSLEKDCSFYFDLLPIPSPLSVERKPNLPSIEYNQIVLKEQAQIKYELVKEQIVFKYRQFQRENELNMLSINRKESHLIHGYFKAYAEMYYFLDRLENDEY